MVMMMYKDNAPKNVYNTAHPVIDFVFRISTDLLSSMVIGNLSQYESGFVFQVQSACVFDLFVVGHMYLLFFKTSAGVMFDFLLRSSVHTPYRPIWKHAQMK